MGVFTGISEVVNVNKKEERSKTAALRNTIYNIYIYICDKTF